jgi:hypothetical protein
MAMRCNYLTGGQPLSHHQTQPKQHKYHRAWFGHCARFDGNCVACLSDGGWWIEKAEGAPECSTSTGIEAAKEAGIER